MVDLTRSFVYFWAYGIGGFLLAAIVLLTAYSAVAGFFFAKPLAGDFEIVQFGTAVAVFSFLPLCQLSRSNVVVDTFTLWAGRRARLVMELLGSFAAAVFATVLLWRMSVGLHDYYVHDEYTQIIGLPLWWAFPPMLFSLALLLFAALITAAETLGFLPATPPSGGAAGRE